MARQCGRTLELGCGTGRVLVPLAKAGIAIVGVDRSVPMLARARQRLRRLRTPIDAALARADIRDLPAAPGVFDLVIAPYGILQSLVREADLARTLHSVARVLRPGGRFGIDLVPDVPNWQEYARKLTLRGQRGPRGLPISLVESVRQDRAKRLTIFDQEFTEGWGSARRVHRFSLTFRTIGVPALLPPTGTRRLHGRRGPRRVRQRSVGSPRRHLGRPGQAPDGGLTRVRRARA